MTERTYKKDIEVIAENFRRELMSTINQQRDGYIDDEYNFENETLIHLSDVLFTHLLPIYNFHIHFLRQLEQRISVWETRSIPGNECINTENITHQIGDLTMNLVEILPVNIRSWKYYFDFLNTFLIEI
jgi:hypothetical protein